MQILPLKLINNLYCFDIDNHTCLIDTGSPESFGNFSSLQIDGIPMKINKNYMSLNASKLSDMIGESVDALIGTDILNKYEIVLNTINNTVSFSKDEKNSINNAIDIEYFMDIPIIEVVINSTTYKMFFDTGAHINYWQDESLSSFNFIEKATDVYPGYGEFATDTYRVDVSIGSHQYQLKCGSLPGLLGMTLAMAGVDGIIGNEIMHNHVIEYSPRNGELVIL
jgi:hypothetical protein